jgi:hypothetical protein
MRSLSHHAKREWLTMPCQRRRAFPSAVLRSERKVRWGAYVAGVPAPRAARQLLASRSEIVVGDRYGLSGQEELDSL